MNLEVNNKLNWKNALLVLLIISIAIIVLLFLSWRKINSLYQKERQTVEEKLNCPACPKQTNNDINPPSASAAVCPPASPTDSTQDSTTATSQEDVLLPPLPPAN